MHTPTPYTANIADARELEPGKYVREVLISGPHFTPDEMGKAAVDAAFIRKACNMHEELTAMLGAMLQESNPDASSRSMPEWDTIRKARALLAKANE